MHRKIAVMSFNEAWAYLDRKTRSPQDDIRMLVLAHTSKFHWELVGTPQNSAIGDWQISRTYAAIGQAGPALRFAESALSTCRKNGLKRIEPSALEGIARAHAVGGNPKDAAKFLAKARSLLEKLDLDKEDRVTFQGQIEDTQRLIDAM